MPVINFIEKHLVVYDLGFHKHNYWEVIYIMSGHGTFEFKDLDAIDYEKGGIIVIPPEIFHHNHPSPDMRNFNLTISNWTPVFNLPTLLSTERSADIFEVLELAYKYYYDIKSNAEIVQLLTNLIAKLIDNCVSLPPISAVSKQIETEIANGFSNPYFNLSELYAKSPYSHEHTRKLFLKEYGLTPHSYLTQRRIDASIQLLSQQMDNNFSIREIAELCGFEDQLYFSRIFKKTIGISPMSYANAQKNK